MWKINGFKNDAWKVERVQKDPKKNFFFLDDVENAKMTKIYYLLLEGFIEDDFHLRPYKYTMPQHHHLHKMPSHFPALDVPEYG